jgi:fimbrial chaperone protein
MSAGAKWMCTAGLALATVQCAVAGAFSVTPTRIELKGNHRTAVVTLRNADAAPLTVQAALVGWTQSGGEDVYADSRDLLTTPPIFTIPPNGEQIVRIALRRNADSVRELPYRIFFQEIPQAKTADFNGLNIALRVGVPIFVQPRSGAASNLQWEVHPLADGKLQIDAINDGDGHVQITDFDLLFGAADQGSTDKVHIGVVKYVLPGSRMSWTVSPPPMVNTGSMRVKGFSDQGDFDSHIAFVPRP